MGGEAIEDANAESLENENIAHVSRDYELKLCTVFDIGYVQKSASLLPLQEDSCSSSGSSSS